MKFALYAGLILAASGGLVAGCHLGEKVVTPNLPPNTFIQPGYPEEGQTWLSNTVTFSFFGADPDNEIAAYYTRLEPALLDTLAPGLVDTLWPGDVGYHDPTPDTLVSFYDWQRTIALSKNYQGLADAYYRFLVRAVDEADGVDPTPAMRHFLILAATWPEIVMDEYGCPPRRNASQVEDMHFHGVLGGLEPYQFEYRWTLIGPPNDPLAHTWTDWTPGQVSTFYVGLAPGATYTWRVQCRILRAGVYIESRGFAECVFTIG